MPVAGLPVGADTSDDWGDLTPIRVFSDGACLPNPGRGGWAWYVDRDRWSAGGAEQATNNTMEFAAVLAALRAIPGPVIIETDSRYVVDVLTRWVRAWQRNGWKKKDGAPVKNRAQIEQILGECRGRWVRIVWVQGHAGDVGNEAADARAVAAREAVAAGRVPDPGPGWFGDRPSFDGVITRSRGGSRVRGGRPSRSPRVGGGRR